MKFKSVRRFIELTDDETLKSEFDDILDSLDVSKARVLANIYVSGLEQIDANKTIAINLLKRMLMIYPPEVVCDWYILMGKFIQQELMDSNTPKRLFNNIILSEDFRDNITLEAGDLQNMSVVQYIMLKFGEIDVIANRLGLE